MSAPTTGNNARRDFYERIGGLSMAPLWESLHQLVPPRPAPKYQAAHWDYDKVRPFLMESGSLITARMASEQGREVFAIPGSIHAPQSRGCHALIKQGAKLVESAQDVLEECRWSATPRAPEAVADDAPTTPATAESPLLQAMGYDPVGLDALVSRTGLDTASLQVQLLELELDGAIARLPGALFQRIGRG